MTTEEISRYVEEVETEIDINTRLINLVKQNSFIYDTKDPRHKDRNLLHGTWSTIASQIDLSIEEAKTKWQRLRNNFSKAIERRIKTPSSGSAATKLQRPWMYEADMEFLRSHVLCQRASSLLKRQAPSTFGSQPLSPQLDMPDITGQISENSLISVSDTASIASSTELDCAPSQKNTKSRKIDFNEFDSAALSFINQTTTKREQKEDPAIGWFKSLLPMYNMLNPIEKLEFQSKVTLELRSFLLAQEQRIAHLTIPPMSTHAINSNSQIRERDSTSHDMSSFSKYENNLDCKPTRSLIFFITLLFHYSPKSSNIVYKL